MAVNLRSAYNVGALFRIADAVGLERLVLTGTCPHPPVPGDTRLPYVANKALKAIAKTALGAEQTVPFEYAANSVSRLDKYRAEGYRLYALERSHQVRSSNLFTFKPQWPAVLVVGEETKGLANECIKSVDEVVEIPMFGQKESLNVASAAGIAAYFYRYRKA
jgi:23S rRNA (guanosine2251-2'-O)-methyltransferase